MLIHKKAMTRTICCCHCTVASGILVSLGLYLGVYPRQESRATMTFADFRYDTIIRFCQVKTSLFRGVDGVLLVRLKRGVSSC